MVEIHPHGGHHGDGGQVGRRERHKIETRRRLLAAAMECFGRRGIAGTSVHDITEAADVGYGTFFNYFPSKESILAELADERIEKIRSSAAKTRDLPTPERIVRLFSASAKDMKKQPELARAMVIEIMRQSATPGEPTTFPRGRFGRLYADILREGVERGDVRDDIDVDEVAELIRSLLFTQLLELLGDPKGPSAGQRAASAVSLIWRGLAPD